MFDKKTRIVMQSQLAADKRAMAMAVTWRWSREKENKLDLLFLNPLPRWTLK